jgi:hypothetical protein
MCFFKLGVMVFSFHSPAVLLLGIAGPEEAKNRRANVLRLIQIRLATLSFEKSRLPVKPNRPQARIVVSNSMSAVKFSSARTTFSVAAMRVNNPDRSPLGIDGRNPAQTPAGSAEIVGAQS